MIGIKKIFFGLILICGFSISSNSQSIHQALLGAVIDAKVNIYRIDQSKLIYETKTIDNNDIDMVGIFTVPNGLIEDSAFYLIEINGGRRY